MSTTTIARFRAAALLAAPAVMLVSFLYHPHIGDPIDPGVAARIAAAVVADPARWAIAHAGVAVGSGLLVLAFLALSGLLRESGEERWSAVAIPFVVLGSTLYAMLPAMEFAPLAAARAGVDAEAVQAALFTWFAPVILTSAAVYFVGVLAFAAAIARSRVLSPELRWLVVAALVVAAASRFVPLAAVQFYVQGVAGVVALWPFAYLALRQPRARAVAGHATSATASA